MTYTHPGSDTAVNTTVAVVSNADKRAIRAKERVQKAEHDALVHKLLMDERRLIMPGILFNIQLEIEKLSSAGFVVSSQVRNSDKQYGELINIPGVQIHIDGRYTNNNDSDNDHYYLHLESDESAVSYFMEQLVDMQQAAENIRKQRELANSVKQMLTPEQQAAFKKYG